MTRIKAAKNYKPKIAIIGAGFSGIILGQELSKISEVKIFEKARGSGGKMSTRRVDEFAFDHGVQCLTARTKDFQNFLSPHILSGDVAAWEGKSINFHVDKSVTPQILFETNFVASPAMNSLCKKLSAGLDISFQTEIIPLKEKTSQGWHLEDKSGNSLGVFDLLISSAPPAQTVNLFGSYISPNQSLRQVLMEPCFALMVGFKNKLQFDWILAKVQNNPLKLISFNSSKPGRNQENSCFVAHTKEAWTKENIGRDIAEVEKILLQNFSEITGLSDIKPDHVSAHLWRYALVEKNPNEKRHFIDIDLGLAATSDWVSNSRVEDVWLSAMSLLKEVRKIYA